ncbi:hypothetical protein HHK36_030556 [Tetracentron sinense]|uniref:Uncharacterized protein n=1 Tax=Tetracentron sinense TaxID=13715 RepID=A0A834Y7Q5_TETSI|nr:hypothetical protein HHK36_030556 [Tetracentron sinense]
MQPCCKEEKVERKNDLRHPPTIKGYKQVHLQVRADYVIIFSVHGHESTREAIAEVNRINHSILETLVLQLIDAVMFGWVNLGL